jgi:ribosomal protein L11 methyltransferase
VDWLRLCFDVGPQAVDALAAALEREGALAVTLEDGADDPVLEPAPGATPLWRSTRVAGLFRADRDPMDLLARLRRDLGGALPTHRLDPLADQDWARAWLDQFRPMRFGRRLWVCPTWATPPADGHVSVVMDPGLAFGTGTHPTTALCMEWLDGASLDGAEVLDYGCGSGILAVAALKLGARRAWAVDIDPQALIAARDNAARNGVAGRLRVCAPGDLGAVQVDVVLANILAGTLIELAPNLMQQLRAGGSAVLSGVLRDQAAAVSTAYRPWVPQMELAERDDWCRLAGIRRA